MGITSGTCSMSATTYSSDSTIKTFDLTCTLIIEEQPSSSLKVFFPVFYDNSICKDGNIQYEYYVNGNQQTSIYCQCSEGNYGSNYDGIPCSMKDNSFFPSTLQTQMKFVLKNLNLPSTTKDLVIDAFFRDSNLNYIIGPRVVLGVQSVTTMTTSDNTANLMNICTTMALRHPTYCTLTFELQTWGEFASSQGDCSSLSSSYDSNCKYTSTSSSSVLTLPFTKIATSNYVLSPSKLNLITSIQYSKLNTNPDDYAIITIKEPTTGNVVETIKTKIKSIGSAKSGACSVVNDAAAFINHMPLMILGLFLILII